MAPLFAGGADVAGTGGDVGAGVGGSGVARAGVGAVVGMGVAVASGVASGDRASAGVEVAVGCTVGAIVADPVTCTSARVADGATVAVRGDDTVLVGEESCAVATTGDAATSGATTVGVVEGLAGSPDDAGNAVPLTVAIGGTPVTGVAALVAGWSNVRR